MTKSSIIKSLLILFSVTAVVNYVLYSSTLPIDIPRGDHWRWLKSALIPYLHGEKSFFDFITYEFYPLSHSHILTISNVWLNYHLFDLDYRIESYIGLISTLCATYLMCKHFWDTRNKNMPNMAALLTITLIIAIFLNIRNVNPWTLVQFEYLYILLTIVFFLIVDAFLNEKVNRPALISVSIFMFFLGDATGTAALAGTIGFLFLFHFKRHALTAGLLIIVIIGCVGLSHLIMTDMRPHTNVSKLEAILYVFNHPIETIKVILIMSSQAIVEKHAIRHFIPDGWEAYQYIIGGIVFSFILFAVYNFYRHEKIRTQALPMLLIMLFAVTMLGVILTRFPVGGVEAGHASRYMRLFQLGFIGAIWINASYITYYLTNKSIKGLFKNGLLLSIFIMTFFIVIGFYTHATFLWKYKPSVEKYFNNELDHIKTFTKDNSYELGLYIPRCKKEFCNDSIIFLEKNGLSYFRESPSKMPNE